MVKDERNSKRTKYSSTAWKVTEIKRSSQCRLVKLSTDLEEKEIERLSYTRDASFIVALASNGSHSTWRLHSDQGTIYDVRGSPRLPDRQHLFNEVVEKGYEKQVHCLVLSRNNSYIISSSGGHISIHKFHTWKTMITLTGMRTSATALALHPEDNNIIAVGFNDSSIVLYDVRSIVAPRVLNNPGDYEIITGIVFSMALKVLVSVGFDGFIYVWSTKDWELKNMKCLELRWTRSPVPLNPSLQLHKDEVQFLVVHPSQICIYEATNLDRKNKWSRGESYAPITCATFSCDCVLVCSTFIDGSVGIFRASDLLLQCVIHPSAYRPTPTRWCRSYIGALVVAANPKVRDEFAIGLSNGEVIVLSPLTPEGTWGIAPPLEKTIESLSGASSSGSNTAKVV